jgi:alkyl sulfatase BDS1-like metallo-beta-lactamase superfamily hydrolase
VGKLLRPEAFFLDFSDSKPITHRKVRAAFENAGRELIANGRISPQTQADAAAPLTADDDVYLERTAVYWAIADDLGTHYADREQLRDLAAEDLRILVPELASCLDPSVAGDLAAVIQLDLQGDAENSWQLKIERGRCRADRGVHPQPDLTLTLSEQALVDMIFCRIDVRTAVSDGTIRVAGSRELLMRMARLFPPPNR